MKLKLFPLLVTFLLVLASCDQSDVIQNIDQLGYEKGEITFSLSSSPDLQTKTIYDANNNHQLNWRVGDRVKIACSSSTPREAVYSVEKSLLSESEGTLKGYSTEVLKWNSSVTDHIFYGAYPENAEINGSVVKFPGLRSQTLVKGAGNDYQPNDMKLAYMAAKGSGVKSSGNGVVMSFNPLFTVLDVELSLTAGSDPVRVSSLKLSYNNESGYIASDGSYSVDCAGLPASYQLKSNTGGRTTEDITVNFPEFEIQPGTKSVLTLFVPPVTIQANTATLVLSVDGAERRSNISSIINGGSRCKLKLGMEKKNGALVSIVGSFEEDWGDDETIDIEIIW